MCIISQVPGVRSQGSAAGNLFRHFNEPIPDPRPPDNRAISTQEPQQAVMMQRKQNILVVDDDPRLLRLVRVNLERAGFIVSTAANGAAAYDEMSANPPDAVVL